VLYTDPAWLVSDGRIDPGLATVERGVLGDRVELRFGVHVDGRFEHGSPGLLERAAGCEVVVVYRCPVTPALLDAAGGSLRAVVRQGVGVDNLDLPLLAARGIRGFNVPDYCVDEVASHTLALALALERRLLAQHRTLAGGAFDIYAGGVPRRLNRRTAGIVGFGRVGRAVARKLGVCYGSVLVYDPYLGRDLPEGYGARAVESLPELLDRADLVTLHCPLTGETAGMVDEPFLRRMRPGSYLVNCARGRLIDPESLGLALAEGRLAGAGLDVFSPENPHDDPRWRPVLAHPGVIVTSHRAFLSVEAEQSSRRRVAELVRDLLSGSEPQLGLVTA
jgi:phosphoglycerate dehydrogenase-like enzyme